MLNPLQLLTSSVTAQEIPLDLIEKEFLEAKLISHTVTNPPVSNSLPYEFQPLTQVTPVSELSDLQPTDWAFQSVRNLIERYGCISGYPDNTFQGNRSLTRYEFAAVLKSCIQGFSTRSVATNTPFLTEAELATLERLQLDFATELAALEEQVSDIDTRTTALEENTFSPTTKLLGNLRLNTSTYFSGEGGTNSYMQYNLFMGLLTSFTGKDLLLTALGATNTLSPELAPTNAGKFIGSTREGLSDTGNPGTTNNSLRIIGLGYQFPVAENLQVSFIAGERYRFNSVILPQFLPYYTVGGGPTSAFGEVPPIYQIGGGAGISVNYGITDSTLLSLTYLSTFANSPNEGFGLFDGDYVASAQLDYNPNPNLFLQAIYQNGYFSPGNFAFNNAQTFRDNGFVGTALANRFDDAGVFFDEASEVSSNAYGVGGYYTVNPRLIIGGWANLFNARLLGKGYATVWTYSLQAAFPDLFREGNLGGLVIGMEPTLTSLNANCAFCDEFKSDTSLHIEAYYRHQLNPRIWITPSFMWITAPNQDADNQDIIIGDIRTTFNF